MKIYSRGLNLFFNFYSINFALSASVLLEGSFEIFFNKTLKHWASHKIDKSLFSVWSVICIYLDLFLTNKHDNSFKDSFNASSYFLNSSRSLKFKPWTIKIRLPPGQFKDLNLQKLEGLSSIVWPLPIKLESYDNIQLGFRITDFIISKIICRLSHKIFKIIWMLYNS